MSVLRKPKVEDLNLIPLMNLFVTMIPLLLLTAAFFHIGMVSVSVPTQSDESTDVASGKSAVTMNIQIDEKGLSLTASGTMDDAELKSLDAFIPKKGKNQDFDKMTKVLARIKKKYEQSDTIMVVPSKKTTYQTMIETMDAARHMEIAVPNSLQKKKIPLFSIVVVTSLVE